VIERFGKIRELAVLTDGLDALNEEYLGWIEDLVSS
jgi:hypothetical protein